MQPYCNNLECKHHTPEKPTRCALFAGAAWQTCLRRKPAQVDGGQLTVDGEKPEAK